MEKDEVVSAFFAFYCFVLLSFLLLRLTLNPEASSRVWGSEAVGTVRTEQLSNWTYASSWKQVGWIQGCWGSYPMSLRVCCPVTSRSCGDWGQKEKGKCHTHLQEGWERESKELQAKFILSLLKDYFLLETIFKLLKCKVIRNKQHEFTKAKLYLTSLIVDHGKMTGSVDKGRVVNIAYLDFSKAFPNVFDSILPVKIVRYGQDKQMIRWMGNWLNYQAKQVVIGGRKSIWQLVASGNPPQGQILGPVWFGVFTVNDLDYGRECTISKFMNYTSLQGSSWYARGQGCY